MSAAMELGVFVEECLYNMYPELGVDLSKYEVTSHKPFIQRIKLENSA